MKKIVLLLLAASVAWHVQGEAIAVQKAVGQYVLLKNITQEQAEQKALELAKGDALRVAGVGEMIARTNVMTTGEDKNENWETFNSFMSNELRGGISEYKVLRSDIVKDEHNNLVAHVEISAVVEKYDTRPDPEFTIQVDGIKGIYLHGQPLQFSIAANRSGYLTLFLSEDGQQLDIVYPNSYEPQQLLKKESVTVFPVNKYIDYTLENSTSKPVQNYMVFVFTKKKVVAQNINTYQDLLNWVYGMEPSDRYIHYEPLSILEKGAK